MNDLFTTIPPISQQKFNRSAEDDILTKIRYSEEFGFRGILLNNDREFSDTWCMAECILDETKKLMPVVSIRPHFNHPVVVAEKVAAISSIRQRQLALFFELNTNDKNDAARLKEYVQLLKLIFSSEEEVNFTGKYFQIYNLKPVPSIPNSLKPELFLSGLPDLAADLAVDFKVTIIEDPAPSPKFKNFPDAQIQVKRGLQLGLLSRKTKKEAWAVARVRFPELFGEYRKSSKVAAGAEGFENFNNLFNYNHLLDQSISSGPFMIKHNGCSFMIGCYQEIARELNSYSDFGFHTCFLEMPLSREELRRTKQVFNLAKKQVQIL